MHPIQKLSPFGSGPDLVNVVIDTPQGSRNKFGWDEELELFSLTGVLPAGAVFPYDFGFVPNTLGGDGDALDVLVLMDAPAFVGCLVVTRLLGVIEGQQSKDGKTERNDRLVAVAVNSRTHESLETLQDLDAKLLEEIEHFFVSYNVIKGKKFKWLGRYGPARARKLVQEGARAARKPT